MQKTLAGVAPAPGFRGRGASPGRGWNSGGRIPDHLFVDSGAGAVALEGSVDHVTFYNPETGFTVLRLRVRGRREPVVVVGPCRRCSPASR